MLETYKEIAVTCPVCETIKNIKIPETIFAQKKFGTIKIQVPQGGVCKEHQFIVFVDTKGLVRGYEKIDLLMKPQEKETDPNRLTLRSFIQKFGLYGVFSLIHAKVFNYPAYILRNKDSIERTDLINNIANTILPENYRETSSITFLDETDYNKIKLREKNSFVMDSQKHILQTPWNEKLKFEEEIIKNALEIINEEEQIFLLQQSISNFIYEAEFVKNVLEKVKDIYDDDLIEKVSRELMMPKISRYRISLIKDFIKQRFSPKLSEKIKNKVEEFLNLL